MWKTEIWKKQIAKIVILFTMTIIVLEMHVTGVFSVRTDVQSVLA